MKGNTTMKRKTIKDVIDFCEMRSGRSYSESHCAFIDIGGGLRSLELIAPEDGGFPRIFYERQRIELEHLMYQLYLWEKERKRKDAS